MTFSGLAGPTADSVWPYVWTAHLIDSAGPVYLTQVDLPGAAVASVTGAALVITTASGPVDLAPRESAA